MQSSNTAINVGLPSLSYGKSKQQRRGWLPLCCIICLAPAAVVAARLAYCLVCLAYCIATLTPASQSYVTREDWFYSKHAIDNTTWPVPKIIHQTYKTQDVPQHWQHARQSCLDLHHDYRYMFWTDQSAREFIAKEYPWFLSSYDSYPHTIQRVDALRYFALHRYGGIYLDLDVGCQWRLDGLRQHGITLPETDPTGFSNDVMAGAPDHPFLLHVIEALSGWNHYYGSKYPTVMFSTGPMFLTMQYMRYRGQRSEILTLPAQLYSGSHGAFFRHYSGSSWHGADSRLVFWLYTNLALVLPLLALAVLLTAAAFWVLLVRDRKRKCY